MSKEQEEKIVKFHFENPEAIMDLKIKGKNAVEISIRIANAFDDVCQEIRESEKK